MSHAPPAPILPAIPTPPRSGLTVVGVGASAGGLEAATQLFAAWPADGGMAFILVQHLDPGSASMMADLLVPHTGLVVCEAAEGAPVLPGHLYVIPPGAFLSVEGGLLRLSEPTVRQGARLPFDFLLHSLARQYGDRSACVVLSGTGADGSAGLRSIKAAGGVVAVQDPAEAGYDGMPRNAVETGMVDFVLPLAKIPAAMAVRQTSLPRPNGSKLGKKERSEPDARTLQDILDLLRTETGHDFALYKSGTLGRRVSRRMALAALPPTDMGGYLALLQADRAELDA